MKTHKSLLISLTVFIILASALYFVGFFLIFRTGQATPLMLSVGVAAICTCLIRKRKLKTLGWSWGQWKYAWMSYFIPLGLILSAYAIIWFNGFGHWYDADFIAQQKQQYNLSEWNNASIIVLHFLITASLTFIMSLPSVLGEEIAWRGFLVPELSRFFNFTGVTLISGFMWAAWHWPLIIKGLYGNNATPLSYQVIIFTTFIMASAVIMTYLRYKTNSLWSAVIYHMSSNAFIQKFFNPITKKEPQSVWFIDEFGCILALVVLFISIYFFKKGVQEFNHTNLLKDGPN